MLGQRDLRPIRDPYLLLRLLLSTQKCSIAEIRAGRGEHGSADMPTTDDFPPDSYIDFFGKGRISREEVRLREKGVPHFQGAAFLL